MVIKTPNGRKTQIWYFDQVSKTIKTRYNNQCWDIKNSGKTTDMQIYSVNSGWFQLFQYRDEYFVNPTNERVLDVTYSKDEEGQSVRIITKDEKVKGGAANQRWKVIYLD